MTDSPPEKPNLDLIQMVQRARMMHDAEATPSAAGGVYWIEAKAPNSANAPTARAGSWRVTVPAAQVDSLWATIKQATEADKLGYKSKVSTAPGPDQRADTRILLVCTYNADDTADVERVRQTLQTLGIQPDEPYQR